jgi:microcystin-dependent protein
MGNPYIGEIRMVGCNFAPVGWALCQGQSLSVSAYEALFSLIGTTYGGDGVNNFNLPDLRSRVPVHQGSGGGGGYAIGEASGTESVTLTTAQLPTHNHGMASTGQAGSTNIPGQTAIMADEGPAGTSQVFLYQPFDGTNQQPLNPQSIALSGGNQPHDNIQPYQALNFIIALEGIFPTPT